MARNLSQLDAMEADFFLRRNADKLDAFFASAPFAVAVVWVDRMWGEVEVSQREVADFQASWQRENPLAVWQHVDGLVTFGGAL
jgi:hypothetical protein